MSDNPFPYMRYVEQGSTPSSPPAGSQRLFVRSSDHVLCMVDSSGTVTALSGSLTNPMTGVGDLIRGGASGTPTRLAPSAAGKFLTDGGAGVAPAWGQGPLTTDGDLLVGATAGTPTRLAKGVAGSFLGLSNGSLAYLAGTSFPGSPATNDIYYRTDLGRFYYYDGTRWLSVQEYFAPFAQANVASSGSASTRQVAPNGSTGIYVTTCPLSTFVNGTNSGSAYWTVTINKTSTANANTSLGSANTSADTGSTWTPHTITVNAVVDAASFPSLVDDQTKTSTPGNLYYAGQIRYRLIAT